MPCPAHRKLRRQAWQGQRAPVVAKHTTFFYTDDDGEPAGLPNSLTRHVEIGSRIDTRPPERMGPSRRSLKREAKKRKIQRLGHKPSAEAGGDAKPVPRPPHSLSNLEKMPIEVLLCITDYLRPKTTACLALASRTLLNTLGTRNFRKLDMASRFMVMDAIQRDHAELVLCTDCQKLHSPWLSLGPPTPPPARFRCRNPSSPYAYTTFHQRLHRNVIDACISRKNTEPTALLRQLCQTWTMAPSLGQETFYVQRSERPLLTPGFLLAKTQTVIVPASGNWNSRTVIGELLAFINTMTDGICSHQQTWEEAFVGILRRPCRPSRPRLRWKRDGEKLLCMLARDRGCLCCGKKCWWATHSLPSPSSCGWCPTDFVLAVAEFPGLPTRALVLATWTSIAERPRDPAGDGTPDGNSLPPYSAPPRTESSPQPLSTPRPDLAPQLGLAPRPGLLEKVHIPRSGVFRMFEGDCFVGPGGHYQPWMTPLDIGRLVDFGHRLEHEGPSCGLPHRTGSDNRILYPDREENVVVSTLKDSRGLTVASQGPTGAAGSAG